MAIKICLMGSENNCRTATKILKDEAFQIVGVINDENKLLDQLDQTGCNLVLVTDITPMSLRSLKQIYLLRPKVIPVVVGNVQDINVMKALMDTGVHYIIPNNVQLFELIAQLKSIYTNESTRFNTLQNVSSESSKSKVIMMFSSKDGVGKTTLAVNLAVKLAQNNNKVCVLDYDMQFGDVSCYFGVNAKDSVAELIAETPNPNVDTIRQFLALHMSGVSFLPAPFSPDDEQCLNVSQSEAIISELRVYFDYIIIDAASGFNDINVNCMDLATETILVSGTDIPSIRNTKKAFMLIHSLMDESKVKLVVSKFGKDSLKKEDIERGIGVPVYKIIQEDQKNSMAASNQGIPVVTLAPTSKMTKSIEELAYELDGVEVKKEKKALFGPKKEKAPKAKRVKKAKKAKAPRKSLFKKGKSK